MLWVGGSGARLTSKQIDFNREQFIQVLQKGDLWRLGETIYDRKILLFAGEGCSVRNDEKIDMSILRGVLIAKLLTIEVIIRTLYDSNQSMIVGHFFDTSQFGDFFHSSFDGQLLEKRVLAIRSSLFEVFVPYFDGQEDCKLSDDVRSTLWGCWQVVSDRYYEIMSAFQKMMPQPSSAKQMVALHPGVFYPRLKEAAASVRAACSPENALDTCALVKALQEIYYQSLTDQQRCFVRSLEVAMASMQGI